MAINASTGEVFSGYGRPAGFEHKASYGQKSIPESARDVNVLREVDVCVVGGGPGGIAAAVSAARGGAKTLLIERYGHLGGMSTGGLVNIIPNLSDTYGKQAIGGVCQELIDRLAARNAATFPEKKYWGSTDITEVQKYVDANMMHFYVRRNPDGERVTLYTAVIDPEVAKDEINTMVLESGAEILLHCLVTEPIMEGNRVKGVILETKSGRQAVLAKIVIDCTGDGDLLPRLPEETVDFMPEGSRIAQFGWIYWIANVDIPRYFAFKRQQPEALEAVVKQITALGGLPRFSPGLLKNQEGVVWIHRLIGSLHQTEPEEMTYVDITARKRAVRNWELLKQYMPGFEKSFLMLSNPQLGTSGGRRLVGEYWLTEKDMDSDTPFPDTIAIFADNDRGAKSLAHPRTYVPYRALVPKGTEGFLVACRAFSADHEFSEYFNLIPHCMCFGQAAGHAAAIALQDGVSVRDVDYTKLRAQLLKYGAILPPED